KSHPRKWVGLLLSVNDDRATGGLGTGCLRSEGKESTSGIDFSRGMADDVYVFPVKTNAVLPR
ncbi:MAG: hypothetical protein ACREBG_13625, partial [Pyrinomonadaceae bacterium]